MMRPVLHGRCVSWSSDCPSTCSCRAPFLLLPQPYHSLPSGMLCCWYALPCSLWLSKSGMLPQAYGFLEYSFLLILSGDVMINLQAQLQFRFLMRGTPFQALSSASTSRHIQGLVHLGKDTQRLDAGGMA